MTSRAIPALSLALAAVACGTGPAVESRAASSAPPRWIYPCPEGACPAWLSLPGACQVVAAQHEVAGDFREVQLAGLEPGVTTTVVGGASVSVNVEADLRSFDWTASAAVELVVALGTAGAHVYVYEPPARSDTALQAFLGSPLRQLTFCSDPSATPAALEVEHVVSTSVRRTWRWSVEKTGDRSAAALSPEEPSVEVAYAVTVAATSSASAWVVAGEVAIRNPHPSSTATVTGVAVVLSPDLAATVSCGVALPHALPAGGTLRCSSSAEAPDGTGRASTATVTTTGPIAGGAATAPADFAGAPTWDADACVTVLDDRAGTLGAVCRDAAPGAFSYRLRVGPYDACGEHVFSNTATAVGRDGGAAVAARWDVAVSVACGCTYTQGYWKTHGLPGPAPYDARWQNVGPAGEATAFFASGLTWYEVFRTPVRGSAYFALAHQYMAAELNVLAGADARAITAALDASEAFFAANGPAAALTPGERAELLRLADGLAAFNEGAVGPGHCGG